MYIQTDSGLRIHTNLQCQMEKGRYNIKNDNNKYKNNNHNHNNHNQIKHPENIYYLHILFSKFLDVFSNLWTNSRHFMTQEDVFHQLFW